MSFSESNDMPLGKSFGSIPVPLDHYDLWTDKKWSMHYNRHRLNNIPHVVTCQSEMGYY